MGSFVFRSCAVFTTLLSLSSLLACSRSMDNSHSNLSIPLPSKPLFSGKMTGLDINGRKECYGVSIRGGGIGDSPRSCGPTTGISVGFKATGETLSLDVPTGDGRVVDVYMLLLPKGETECPTWDSSFEDAFGSIYYSVYKVGSVSGVVVSGEETIVKVTVQAPTDLTQNTMKDLGQDGSCKVTPNAQLQSNGDVINSAGSSADLTDSPRVSSFSNQAAANFSSNSILSYSPGGQLTTPVGSYTTPPYIQAIVRHPGDSNSVLGLRLDGYIVGISLASGQAAEFSAATCPLSTCKVPVWMKSIALGANNKLYSLDYGGGVYYLSKSGPLPTSTKLEPFIDQIAF